MQKSRWTFAAIAFVCGVGIALLFLAWAVPEFRSPSDARQLVANNVSSRFGGWVTGGDTIAQWAIAALSIVATAVSIWAVRLVNDTLQTNMEANEIAAQTAQRQLRAYLAIGEIELLELGTQFVTRISIGHINFGQTPAHNIRVKIGVKLVIKETGKPFDEHEGGNEPGLSLGPSQTRYAFKHITNEKILEGAKSGTGKLYVWGQFYYDDVFGQKHWTKFKGHFEFDEGNKTDNRVSIFIISNDGNEAS